MTAPPKVVLGDYAPELSIEEITLGGHNVRQTGQKSDLDGLKASISRMGVLQPVIVIREGEHSYTLISGQRRLYACQELGLKSIPALIVTRQTGPEVQRLVSFGENVHRKPLSYEDTLRVVSDLYDGEKGPARARIKKIVADLSLDTRTVTRYLGHRLMPARVTRLVGEHKLSMDVADKIAGAFFPDTKKIVAIAEAWPDLTDPEKRRALALGVKKPKASSEEVLREAKNPPLQRSLVVPLDTATYEALETRAKADRYEDVPALVVHLIDEYLKGNTGA
ncbi:MAG: ParB/RepB/Spo0J family partition protein [Thermoplasmata archaeon]|jgi:ParB/RepB/Spo0J family partition protein